MKRTELHRGKPLAQGKPLTRTVGLARRTVMPRQPAQRVHQPRTDRSAPVDTRETLSARSGGSCEVGLLGTCTGQASDWHHRQRRREGDHRPSNALHLCRRCHSWAHAHPTEARHWGWIVSAWTDPASVPARVRGRLTYLTIDGLYLPCPLCPATRDETSPSA